MLMLRRRGSRTGPERDFYLLDVTELWNTGQHSYWAFTEPSWYRWVTGEDPGPPPPSVARANRSSGDIMLPSDPSANDRALFVYSGGVIAQGGHYIGGEAELTAWLGDRTPLGVVTLDEYNSPVRDE